MIYSSIQSIHTNNLTFHWKIISGVAVGVQKYAKAKISYSTHLTGDDKDGYTRRTYPSSVENEIIVELVVQQEDESSTALVLRQLDSGISGAYWLRMGQRSPDIERVLQFRYGNIQVRDGQYVSAIFACVENKSSQCLFFINHDDHEYFFCEPNYQSFITGLRVFQLPWIIRKMESSGGFMLLTVALFSIFMGAGVFHNPILFLIFIVGIIMLLIVTPFKIILTFILKIRRFRTKKILITQMQLQIEKMIH
jgi:hypothetical protein